ncbi:MAG: hypothetical protein U5K81_04285 [Trueperaceae bacterium]|nr:hypothetical protein [Trueperaceae bacterium]
MSARRRMLFVTLGVLALAAVAGTALSVLGGVRITLGSDAEGGPISFTGELPAATCTKTFHDGFPWIRLSCEPHSNTGTERAPAPPEDVSPRLDTAPRAE